MSRKVLFFDIDGTLLSEVTKQVPESAKEAVARTRANGNLVFINTGRSFGELGAIKDMITVDGWLCGCGTYVEAEGNILYHYPIPKEQAEKIKASILAYNLDGFLEGREGCYTYGETSRFPLGNSIRKGMNPATTSMDWTKSCGEFDKFCVISDEQSDKVGFFRELGLDIDVIDRGDGFYECVPAGHSKATGIDVVLAHYGLRLEDAYVFGDSTNDLSMFEYVPNAVLMGHHDKELEPYASFLTKTVEQDGIWYAMEHLGLL